MSWIGVDQVPGNGLALGVEVEAVDVVDSAAVHEAAADHEAAAPLAHRVVVSGFWLVALPHNIISFLFYLQ